jgi:hypothetical protein
MNPDQVGLLILRVWVEPGSALPARLQLRTTTDPAAGFTRTRTLADIEQAITDIRAFLQSLLGDTSSGRRAAPGPLPPPRTPRST